MVFFLNENKPWAVLLDVEPVAIRTVWSVVSTNSVQEENSTRREVVGKDLDVKEFNVGYFIGSLLMTSIPLECRCTLPFD